MSTLEQWVKIGKNLLHVPAGHPMPRYRVQWGCFDRPLQWLASALDSLDRLPCAIDVGANIGDSLAQICHQRNLPVLCIEPATEYLGALEANIERIGSGAAVRALIADGELSERKLVTGAGTARLVEDHSGNGGTSTVPLEALLDEWPAFQKATLVKIDTDGFDLDVIRSGWPWIIKAKPALFFEFDMTFGRATINDGRSMLEQLVAIGYRYFLLFDNFGHLVYDLDLHADSFDTALRYLRSNITHGKVAYYFDIAALPDDGGALRQAVLAEVDATLADAAPTRIAVVRLDNLGDHVLGSGLFRSLRLAHPKSQITAIINQSVAGYYARCPHIDNIVALPDRKAYLSEQTVLDAVGLQLGSLGGFDLVINPRFAEDYYLAGMFCKSLARPGASVVGFRQQRSPYEGYDANTYFTRLINAPETLHAATYAAALVGALGFDANAALPEAWYLPEDRDIVVRRLGLQRPYVVVGCGASFPFKLPSDLAYEAAGRSLAEHALHATIVVIGDSGEASAVHALRRGLGAAPELVSAIGTMPLPELCALIAGASLYVGPDAGPKHIAAAVGVPVVELAWVPADYPDWSRGIHTAGRAWSPFTPASIVVSPDAAQFWSRRRSPDFATARACGHDAAALDAAIAGLLSTADLPLTPLDANLGQTRNPTAA